MNMPDYKEGDGLANNLALQEVMFELTKRRVSYGVYNDETASAAAAANAFANLQLAELAMRSGDIENPRPSSKCEPR